MLRKEGLRPAWFDGTFARGAEEFERSLRLSRPHSVGIYATVISRRTALLMGEIASRLGVPAVAGGPDPSSAPDIYLRGGHFAAVAKGEGEGTAVELARHFLGEGPELSDIAGIHHLDRGEARFTGDRPYIMDLDTVPYPAKDLVDWPSYERITRRLHGATQTTVMTARGCPFRCTWCCKPIFGAKYRHRSARNVAGEMRSLKETLRPQMVRFADDIFTINRKKFFDLADELERQDATIPFECLSRVDLVDRDVLQRLREIGCVKILYGVESGSQRVLDSMKKGITLEEIGRVSRWTREFGIKQYWFMIYGFPPEDVEDLRASIRLIRERDPDDYGVTVAYPLPGTEFYEQVEHTMVEGDQWVRTRDNKVLYRTKYGNLFYRLAIYGTRVVHATNRVAKERTNWLTGIVDRAAYGLVEGALVALARVHDPSPPRAADVSPGGVIPLEAK